MCRSQLADGARAEAMGWEATSPCASSSRELVLAAVHDPFNSTIPVPAAQPNLCSLLLSPVLLHWIQVLLYPFLLWAASLLLLVCFWLLHSVYIPIWVIKTQCMGLQMIQYLMDCDCFSWLCNLWAIQYSLIVNCCCCWNVVAKDLELWFITNILTAAAKPQ